jgi:hypothetical protein
MGQKASYFVQIIKFAVLSYPAMLLAEQLEQRKELMPGSENDVEKVWL